jgi:hypothetical protein
MRPSCCKLGLHSVKQLAEFLRLCDVGLDNEPICAALPNLGQGRVGGWLILVVMDGNRGALFGQLEGDARPIPENCQ